jgi:hypothetical protein
MAGAALMSAAPTARYLLAGEDRAQYEARHTFQSCVASGWLARARDLGMPNYPVEAGSVD